MERATGGQGTEGGGCGDGKGEGRGKEKGKGKVGEALPNISPARRPWRLETSVLCSVGSFVMK